MDLIPVLIDPDPKQAVAVILNIAKFENANGNLITGFRFDKDSNGKDVVIITVKLK